MAIDTRDRRASAVHVGLPWRGLLPLADVGAEDQGDRQQAGGYYRGILAAAPSNIPLLFVAAFTLHQVHPLFVIATAARASGIIVTHPEVREPAVTGPTVTNVEAY